MTHETASAQYRHPSNRSHNANGDEAACTATCWTFTGVYGISSVVIQHGWGVVGCQCCEESAYQRVPVALATDTFEWKSQSATPSPNTPAMRSSGQMQMHRGRYEYVRASDGIRRGFIGERGRVRGEAHTGGRGCLGRVASRTAPGHRLQIVCRCWSLVCPSPRELLRQRQRGFPLKSSSLAIGFVGHPKRFHPL